MKRIWPWQKGARTPKAKHLRPQPGDSMDTRYFMLALAILKAGDKKGTHEHSR